MGFIKLRPLLVAIFKQNFYLTRHAQRLINHRWSVMVPRVIEESTISDYHWYGAIEIYKGFIDRIPWVCPTLMSLRRPKFGMNIDFRMDGSDSMHYVGIDAGCKSARRSSGRSVINCPVIMGPFIKFVQCSKRAPKGAQRSSLDLPLLGKDEPRYRRHRPGY